LNGLVKGEKSWEWVRRLVNERKGKIGEKRWEI
jgi:hypothetical protein